MEYSVNTEVMKGKIMDQYETLLRDALPNGWSYGYVGNVYSDGTDDRLWQLYPPAVTRCGYGTGVGGWACFHI